MARMVREKEERGSREKGRRCRAAVQGAPDSRVPAEEIVRGEPGHLEVRDEELDGGGYLLTVDIFVRRQRWRLVHVFLAHPASPFRADSGTVCEGKAV